MFDLKFHSAVAGVIFNATSDMTFKYGSSHQSYLNQRNKFSVGEQVEALPSNAIDAKLISYIYDYMMYFDMENIFLKKAQLVRSKNIYHSNSPRRNLIV